MSCQIFLFSPKFNKKPIYNSPANKYQEFSNAFVYSIMVMTGNGTLNRADRRLDPPLPTIHSKGFTQEIPVNAAAQKKASNEITIAEKKLTEFEQIYNLTTDFQLRHDMYEKIVDLRDQIKLNKNKIVKLKRNAKYVQKCKEKKQKILHENQEVIKYDKPGQLPLFFKHLGLHDHIHDSIEFESADEK
ncbi:hypothetical protein GLOIN_2v1766467 [Rhizophagus irregularis DAOM 181602=DAOM 197198]|nr:hypothetical protein GLOIN_2v1766467 [Rhizophagus irregularis DAOM 181602=DAOM 197198]